MARARARKVSAIVGCLEIRLVVLGRLAADDPGQARLFLGREDRVQPGLELEPDPRRVLVRRFERQRPEAIG